MSKTKKVQNGYVCALHGGVMKQGWTYLFSVDVDGDVDSEFEKYREYFGPDVKGRYVKTTEPTESLEKLFDLDGVKANRSGETNLFEISITNCTLKIKEATGAKTASTWGPEEEIVDAVADDNEKGETKAAAKKVVAAKKPAKKATAKPAEDEEEAADEEVKEDEEEAKKPAKKAPAKSAAKKAAPKTPAPEVEEENDEVEAEAEEEAEEEEKPAAKKVVAKKAPAKAAAKKPAVVKK